MASRDTCIVFLTHVWDESIAYRFDRLRRESAPHADCFLLLQDDDAQAAEKWKTHLVMTGAVDALFSFNSTQLPRQLGFRYFGAERVRGNTHFPLLLFARSHDGYRHFWQVEGDVEYRGRWGDFFAGHASSEAALIAAHIHRWQDWPEWFWWSSLSVPQDAAVPREQLYKAFLPVMRISREALGLVDAAHREGWFGHFEAVVPTVLLKAGCAVEDLNRRTACYAGWYQDPIPLLPLQSTLRCRPHVTANEFAQRGQGALLFHPVKERWSYDGEKVVAFRS